MSIATSPAQLQHSSVQESGQFFSELCFKKRLYSNLEYYNMVFKERRSVDNEEVCIKYYVTDVDFFLTIHRPIRRNGTVFI